MQMLVAGEVATDHDQVHPPLVLDVEVRDGNAAGVEDAESEARHLAARKRCRLGNKAVSHVGDGEARSSVPAGRGGLGDRGPVAVRMTRRHAGVAPAVRVAKRVEAGARQCGRAEDHAENGREGRDAGRRPHPRSEYPASATAAATAWSSMSRPLTVRRPVSSSTSTPVTPEKDGDLLRDRGPAVGAGHALDAVEPLCLSAHR